jgi:hypothetical protein
MSLLQFSPVKCQVISRSHLDRVRRLYVTQNVTSQVDGGQIFDRPVVVTTLSGCAIVSWYPDALEGALIYTIDINALLSISKRNPAIDLIIVNKPK